MAEEKATVSAKGLARLDSAFRGYAQIELTRLENGTIEELQAQPALGVMCDVAVRHLWDEYCWSIQEEPLRHFDELVRISISERFEKLPPHAKIFLSALAFDEDGTFDGEDWAGAVSTDGVVKLVLDHVNERASRRNLDLIGPNRTHAVGYHIEGTGIAWAALSELREAIDLIEGHVDTMVDPNADLSILANEMAEAYLNAMKDAAKDNPLGDFLERFEAQVRSMILELDIIPSLEDMRASLLERLDE